MNSIIVGHGLDNDLLALKLIHSTVVDTAVAYNSNPTTGRKPALKTLALTRLQKAIQEDLDGHDSAEDAIAAMELAIKLVNINKQSVLNSQS